MCSMTGTLSSCICEGGEVVLSHFPSPPTPLALGERGEKVPPPRWDRGENACRGVPPMSPPDPAAGRLYKNARREAGTVLLVWLISLLWTITYCYLRGYTPTPDSWVVRLGLAR